MDVLDDEAENRCYEDHHEDDGDDLEECCPFKRERSGDFFYITEYVFPGSHYRILGFSRKEGDNAGICDEKIDEQDDRPPYHRGHLYCLSSDRDL